MLVRLPLATGFGFERAGVLAVVARFGVDATFFVVLAGVGALAGAFLVVVFGEAERLVLVVVLVAITRFLSLTDKTFPGLRSARRSGLT